MSSIINSYVDMKSIDENVLIKIETGVTGNTASEKQIRTSLIPISNVSLHDLFEKINLLIS
jgi:hypothetical protein